MSSDPLTPMQTKPLANRIPDLAHGVSNHSSWRVEYRSRDGLARIVLPSPFFTRFGVDTPVPPSWEDGLCHAHRSLGLDMVRDAAVPMAGKPASLPARPLSIAVGIDEPLPHARCAEAERIEFQFFPSSAETARGDGPRGNGRGAWAPCLPSDLTNPEQLRDRVEWARLIGASSGVLIGGAIAAASVYEDVRYLIDSGFDYVCVLADGCFGPDPRQRVRFGDPEGVVVQGLRAIGDSGHPDFGLQLAAAELDPKRVVAWLQAGVRAVCVDGLLQSASSETSGRVGEGFGGFLGVYPRVEDPHQSWLPMALLGFREELRGELEFAGYSDLERMRVDRKPIRVSKPTT